jgi:isopenicillin-N epimerase
MSERTREPPALTPSPDAGGAAAQAGRSGPMDRRQFLSSMGLALAAGVLGSCADDAEQRRGDEAARDTAGAGRDDGDWDEVRNAFSLARDKVHLSALLISSHPRPVREAIDRYRRALDQDPAGYLERENSQRREEVRTAAARYLGAGAGEIALTDSTTMGIALVYHGLRLKPGDEVLTTEHDYYATHESLRLAAARSRAKVRRVRLHQQTQTASAGQIVANIRRSITRRTRVLALTWVHSSTGLKLPMDEISAVVKQINGKRNASERVLICLDGVHGFGVEDVEMDDLGCDFFMAGCHKWLFGPRGTGIVWGKKEAWRQTRPTIPSFMDGQSWNAWALERPPAGPSTAARMSPGGFKPFEHQWAMADTFRFHEAIGKSRIAARTRQLSRQLKEGLAAMPHVRLHTPLASELSAGIVCFDVQAMSETAVVERLRDRGIVATTTPYAESHARLTPCIYNTAEDIDAALREVRAMA